MRRSPRRRRPGGCRLPLRGCGRQPAGQRVQRGESPASRRAFRRPKGRRGVVQEGGKGRDEGRRQGCSDGGAASDVSVERTSTTELHAFSRMGRWKQRASEDVGGRCGGRGVESGKALEPVDGGLEERGGGRARRGNLRRGARQSVAFAVRRVTVAGTPCRSVGEGVDGAQRDEAPGPQDGTLRASGCESAATR